MNQVKRYYRRRLPHIQPEFGTFFVTFRLVGSLPKAAIARLRWKNAEQLRTIAAEENSHRRRGLLSAQKWKYFQNVDEYLGSLRAQEFWLSKPEVLQVVADAIHHRDGRKYVLLAYCIMPNHVHLVIRVERNDISLYRILQSLKRHTAREANKLLSRTGQFWQHESYDRVIRNDRELERIIWCIVQNPVEASLCPRWDQWKWTYIQPDLKSRLQLPRVDL